jgi:hypothetical protein
MFINDVRSGAKPPKRVVRRPHPIDVNMSDKTIATITVIDKTFPITKVSSSGVSPKIYRHPRYQYHDRWREK